MEKYYLYAKKFLWIFLLISMINFCFLISWASRNTSEELTIMHEPQTVYLTDKIYMLNENIVLLHDPYSNMIQCFNTDGAFVWGVKLAQSRLVSDENVSFDEKHIYLLENITNKVYVFENFELIQTEEKSDAYTQDDFCAEYPAVEAENIRCRFSLHNAIKVYEKEELQQKIFIQAKISYYSPVLCFAVMVLSGGLFFVLKKYEE